MHTEVSNGITVDTIELPSEVLNRTVTINIYGGPQVAALKDCSLLLFNDGQDIEAMGFDKMLQYLQETDAIDPLLCVGIHAGEERLLEYGMISTPDFKGRGARAQQYRQFIIEELLPFIHKRFNKAAFKEIAFAGFSLGGLSVMDLAWNHPDIFSKVGVFSGSLWWRLKDKKDKEYNEANDRLMHREVRMGHYHPGQKFFFCCGEQDEAEDRNNNGVIDSIDDTIDLMRELMARGWMEGKDMYYLQLPDGKHDVRSWAKALPVFLKWGWRKKQVAQ
jgi:enterochelin esterase-like enzyme